MGLKQRPQYGQTQLAERLLEALEGQRWFLDKRLPHVETVLCLVVGDMPVKIWSFEAQMSLEVSSHSDPLEMQFYLAKCSPLP